MVGILCGAALQCLRRPCEKMHVRVAVLGVAERFADDAATAQRRAEAMGYGRSVRGQVSNESGAGGRTAATGTEYSRSTPQGTRVGKGERAEAAASASRLPPKHPQPLRRCPRLRAHDWSGSATRAHRRPQRIGQPPMRPLQPRHECSPGARLRGESVLGCDASGAAAANRRSGMVQRHSQVRRCSKLVSERAARVP
jgi:hypothetical protein